MGIKILDQNYTYIIIRYVTGYYFPSIQACLKESHHEYQRSQKYIFQSATHVVAGELYQIYRDTEKHQLCPNQFGCLKFKI